MREVPCGYCGMVHSFYGMTIAPTVCHNCGNPFHRHEEKQMPTPRPHYKERIAHAEGYEIECRFKGRTGEWSPCEDPGWHTTYEYRVKPEQKPEQKPDVVHTSRVSLDCFQDLEFSNLGGQNLRLTFDGETGALKHAEVIQQS